jgi:hypothetical protein
MARTSITIDLELDDTDSPVGAARLADGTCLTFHGWLALAEAIDSLAGMNAQRTATPSIASRPAEPDPAGGRHP